MRALIHSIHLCVLYFVFCNFVSAADNPLRIALVSEVTSIQPGQPFHVGLHLQHPRGYHTYWKFTGIVGVPTSIEWKLPKGWKADEIEWPEPERVFMYEIKAQGFHEEKLLPIRITPPKNLQAGQAVKLEGKATWMCCGRDCNPGFKDLSIELPVSAEIAPHNNHWSKQFAQSLASVPRPCADWTCAAQRKGEQIVLHIKPSTDAAKQQFSKIKDLTFFTDDGLVDPNKPESLTKTDNEIVLTQTISEYAPKPLPDKVTGILQSPQGWLADGKPKSITISVPLTAKNKQ